MANSALSVRDPTSLPPPSALADHLMINGFVKPLGCGSRNPALMALQLLYFKTNGPVLFMAIIEVYDKSFSDQIMELMSA